MAEPHILVEVNSQGRMTLPAKVREALGIKGRSQLALEVVDDQVRLRPTVVLPREDAWAFTQEHMNRLRRALADVEAGRERYVTREELEAIDTS